MPCHEDTGRSRTGCTGFVVFDEDRSQVRRGNGPHSMVMLPNLAITLLRMAGATNIVAEASRAKAREALAAHRHPAGAERSSGNSLNEPGPRSAFRMPEERCLRQPLTLLSRIPTVEWDRLRAMGSGRDWVEGLGRGRIPTLSEIPWILTRMA